MSFQLTDKNYYDKERPHISSSKINDYLVDPFFYKQKHVLGKIPRKLTPAMQLGSFVDAELTDPKEAAKYYVKPPRSRDKDPHAITQAMCDDGMLRVKEVKRHPFWQREGAEYQIILEAYLDKKLQLSLEPSRLSVPICGKPDRVDFLDNGDIALMDIKCVNPTVVKTPKKWFYEACNRGYDVQFAIYRAILSLKTGVPVERIHCFHLCVTNENNFATAQLFYFTPQAIDAVDTLWRDTAWLIKRKKFPQKSIHSFSDAVLCAP